MVKANGYGHGAVPVARAALEAGAAWLGVALVEEGVQLRDAGIDAPILLLSEPRPEAARVVAAAAHARRLHRGRDRRAGQGGRRLRAPPLAVHLKVDTGMHRVGCAPDDARRARQRDRRAPTSSTLAGVCTHLAVADEPDNPYTAEQLGALRRGARRARRRRAATAARARGQLRRRCSSTRRAATTSCGVGIARLRHPARAGAARRSRRLRPGAVAARRGSRS